MLVLVGGLLVAGGVRLLVGWGTVLLLGLVTFNSYLFWEVIVLVQLLVYLVYVLRLFAVVLFDFAVLVVYVGGCVVLSYFGFRLLAFYVFDIVGLG